MHGKIIVMKLKRLTIPSLIATYIKYYRTLNHEQHFHVLYFNHVTKCMVKGQQTVCDQVYVHGKGTTARYKISNISTCSDASIM